MSSTHYHILSRHFIDLCLFENIDHVMGWHAFLNFGGRRSCSRCFTLNNNKGYWKNFIVPILCNCHKEGPLDLLYNHVLSTLTTSLQYWNSLIHNLKLQKRRLNITKPSIAWPLWGGIGSVSFSMTIPGRNICIACNNIGKSWYDIS